MPRVTGSRDILQQVLADILPDEKRILGEAEQVVESIQTELDKASYDVKAVLGGSVAKRTFLRQDHDIDIFVMFDRKKYATADLSAMLEPVLKKLFQNVVRIHGSRDYFQVKNKFRFEIVPILHIRKPEEAANITDCSPLHVHWVRKFPKLSDEIRLAKAFCKAIGVYGAESYIQGFSGHVIDIITTYYEGFLPLLRASQKWKVPTVIDFYNKHKGKALQELNQSKLQSPLIVIDPIQAERNAAAALGKEKFLLFREKAGRFLKRPGKGFFIQEEVTVETLKRKAKGKKLCVVTAIPTTGKEDVIGAQLRKAFEHCRKMLELKDFKIAEAGWHWDKAQRSLFWFVTDPKPLSATVEWQGPPARAKEHADAFKAKYPQAFLKKGRWYAVVKRAYTRPEHVLAAVLEEPAVKSKCAHSKLEVFT